MSATIIAGIGLALTAASMIGSFAQGQASASAQKKALKLQQKQFELDLKQSYLSSLDKLTQLEGEYKNTQLAIMQQNADIASSEAWLDRFSGYYAAQLGQTIDQGVPHFQALTTNWQNQLTLAAERGQTGSTARMLAAIQRQNLANFAGEDLTLDTQGGSFGRALSEQQQDLLAEQQTVQNSIKVGQQTLGIYNDTLNDYLRSIGTTLGSAVAMGHDSGQSYEALAELVDQYKDYFGDVSESEFNSIKADLLKDYEPIDFEIRQNSVTYDISDENSHITDYFYEIYDKATGKLATEDQINTLLRTYASNVKESQLYTTVGYSTDSKKVLSTKAIKAIRKNSNYDARKDFT